MRVFLTMLSLVMVFGFPIATDASDHVNTLSQAIELYEQRAYEESLILFLEVLDQGLKNSDIYYNIGNCYFRLGRIGKAILYYERAKKLNPKDRDVLLNLSYAKSYRVDAMEEDDRSFIIDLLNKNYDRLSVNDLSIINVFLLIILVSLINTSMIAFKQKDKSAIFFFIIALSLLFIISSVASIAKYHSLRHDNRAVLVENQSSGYSGPGSDYTRLFTINEGFIVKVIQSEELWSLVRLPNGASGWIKSDYIEKINY